MSLSLVVAREAWKTVPSFLPDFTSAWVGSARILRDLGLLLVLRSGGKLLGASHRLHPERAPNLWGPFCCLADLDIAKPCLDAAAMDSFFQQVRGYTAVSPGSACSRSRAECYSSRCRSKSRV